MIHNIQKCILLILIFLMSLHTSAQEKRMQSFYQAYKPVFDRKDTVKKRALTSGSCYYESLDQYIKKDDSTLTYNTISTPCLDKKYLTMPPIDSFDYTPYTIDVPLSFANPVYFNLQNATGRLRVIDKRRDLTTHIVKKYTPYTDYKMDFIEFIEFAKETNKEYGIYDIILENMKGSSIHTDLFSDYYRHSFGNNPTFYIGHMWGVHITENFIILLENVQNGLIIDDVEEKDFTKTFIRMAESVRAISPDLFNLNELDSYKK